MMGVHSGHRMGRKVYIVLRRFKVRYNTKELRYEQVEIFGKKALFSDERIDMDSVPKGFSLYEVRHDDDGVGHPKEIARGILVNFYGTLLIEDGLPEADKSGWVLVEDEDWQYIGERICTLEEYFLQGNSKQMEQNVPLVRMLMVKEKEVLYTAETVDSPEKVAEFAKGILQGADREYLLVLSVDSKCKCYKRIEKV